MAAGQTVAVLGGADGTATSVPIFSANPLAPVLTAGGLPSGAFQVLSKPGGSKFYLLTGSPGITVLDANFSHPVQILASLGATALNATMSPDGRRLFVIAGAQALFIDTRTDTVIGAPLNITGTPLDIAFGRDGQTAYILSSTGAAAFLTPVDLATNSAGNAATFPIIGTSAGITLGPNGLLYVNAPNALFEIDPRTLAITPGSNPASAATIQVNGLPGKAQFTSDSLTAVALNRTPASGAAMIFDLAGRTAIVVPSVNLDGPLDQLTLASDTRIFARSSQNTLYELTLDGALIRSPAAAALPSGSQILSILPSNEAQARSLFVLAAGPDGTRSLNRIDLPANTLGSSAVLPDRDGRMLAFAGANPEGGALSVQGIGTFQVLLPGTASQPLSARVLNAAGVPVFNAVVNFTVLCGGVTLSSTAAVTDSAGYVQVYATAGTSPGYYLVQATVPGGSAGGAGFTIDVAGGTGVPGGCTPNYNPAGLYFAGGNGQLVPEQQVAQQLLMVIAKDADDQPVANQPVLFSVVLGDGTILCTGVGEQFPYIPTGSCRPASGNLLVMTDSTGQAGVKFLATSILGQSFAQAVVNAASPTGSQNFTVTTVLVGRANGTPASLPGAYLLAPQPGNVPGFTGMRILTGATGQTLRGGLQVQVVPIDGPQAGQPIPNVSVTVASSGDPRKTPSASCTGGFALTDSTGVASCDVVIGPVVGNAPLNVTVGGAIILPLIGVLAAPNLPFRIQTFEGNNQSGSPGQQISLRAHILDGEGNSAPNVPVAWAVTQGSGTIGGVVSRSDGRGDVQSTLTLGPAPGPVVVALSAGFGPTRADTVFSVMVNGRYDTGAITLVSGGGQVAVAGQAFSAPVVVRVTGPGGDPIPGAMVTFGVAFGTASLGSPTAITDAQGRAATSVIAGQGAGSILITAWAGNRLTQFTLASRRPGPSIGATSFRNAASNVPGLNPCGIAVVSGTGLAPALQGTMMPDLSAGPLPLELSGLSLTVNGISAPLLWVSNTPDSGEAAAFQTPCEVTPGPATVVVSVNDTYTFVAGVAVAKYQPGIFETVMDGRKYAVLQHASGTYVTLDNPARRGEQLKMFVTGFGVGLFPAGTNRVGIGGQPPNAIVNVGVNNAGVRVIGSEYLPGAIGIYSVTFEVPTNTAVGIYQNLGLFVSDPGDPAGTAFYAIGSFLPIGN